MKNLKTMPSLSSVEKHLVSLKKNGNKLIFRGSITIKGKKLLASDYGLRGFPIWI